MASDRLLRRSARQAIDAHGSERPAEIECPSLEEMGKRYNGYVLGTFGKDVPFSEASCGTSEQVFGQKQNIAGAFDCRHHCIISPLFGLLVS